MEVNKKRTIRNTCTHVRSNGVKKKYYSTKTYTIEGYIHENGEIYKVTPEQLAEMKRKYADGVTKKRLATDYGLCYNTVHKYLTT